MTRAERIAVFYGAIVAVRATSRELGAAELNGVADEAARLVQTMEKQYAAFVVENCTSEEIGNVHFWDAAVGNRVRA